MVYMVTKLGKPDRKVRPAHRHLLMLVNKLPLDDAKEYMKMLMKENCKAKERMLQQKEVQKLVVREDTMLRMNAILLT